MGACQDIDKFCIFGIYVCNMQMPFLLVDLRNEVCFPCCRALMKTKVRLGESESRSADHLLLNILPNVPMFS
jgi:hypothetical protein